MRMRLFRPVCVLACGLWLAGCTTDSSFSDLLSAKAPAPSPALSTGLEANAMAPTDNPPPLGVDPADMPGQLGSQPYDDLNIGKRYYRVGNYGMAERYFRRAVEQHPTDAEAWLDLAASYDHTKRFDLADRAYGQAIQLAGPKIEILNNQGYSYMLRGDNARAYEKLNEALRRAPGNPYVISNLRLLQASAGQAKAIE